MKSALLLPKPCCRDYFQPYYGQIIFFSKIGGPSTQLYRRDNLGNGNIILQTGEVAATNQMVILIRGKVLNAVADPAVRSGGGHHPENFKYQSLK